MNGTSRIKPVYIALAMLTFCACLYLYNVQFFNKVSLDKLSQQAIAPTIKAAAELPAVPAPIGRELFLSANSNDTIISLKSGWRVDGYLKLEPLTQAEVELPELKDTYLEMFLNTKNGMFYRYQPYAYQSYDAKKPMYGLEVNKSQLITLQSSIPSYGEDTFNAILETPDQSVVLLYFNRNLHNKLLKIEIVQYRNGALSSHLLEVRLPTSLYHSKSVVLQDGRLMLIGGCNSEYECELKRLSNATFFVDLATGKLSKGPNMLAKRMNMEASLLPNGNVLLTGGKGKLNENNPRWSDVHLSTELFDVKQNRFLKSAPMVVASQKHSAKWVAGYEGKFLMVDGSKAGGALQYYDVESDCWHYLRNLNENEVFVQTAIDQSGQVALVFSPPFGAKISTQPFHLPYGCNQSPINQLNTAQELVLNAKSFRFIPAKSNTQPNYIVSGQPLFCEPYCGESVNATRLIWNDGRTQTISQVVLPKLPSIESLPAPIYPVLNDVNNSSNHAHFVELADGRKVLHGGMLYAQKVAKLQIPEAPLPQNEQYVGVDMPKVADLYQIFDPKTNSWTASVKSKARIGMMAVLDSGTVFHISRPKIDWVKLKQEQIKSEYRDKRAVYHSSTIEISDTAGAAWHPFGYMPHAALDEEYIERTAKPFVIQNELFIAGVRVLSSDDLGYRKYSYILEWFDTQKKQWEIIWERHEKPYVAVGRQWNELGDVFVFVSLANGKKMLLPVNGYQ